MKKYAMIIDKETKAVAIGEGTDNKYYESIGMTEMEVEEGSDGGMYVKGYAPQKELTVAEYNAEIDRLRESEYRKHTDKIGFMVLRGEKTMEEWISAMDAIRAKYPHKE